MGNSDCYYSRLGDIYPVTVEGKIIASILMIIGIGILGVLISTLGASSIESKLKPKINMEAEESKKKINEKICKIELLDKEEYSSLIFSINTLYNYLRTKHKNENSDNSACQNAIILILKILDFVINVDVR